MLAELARSSLTLCPYGIPLLLGLSRLFPFNSTLGYYSVCHVVFFIVHVFYDLQRNSPKLRGLMTPTSISNGLPSWRSSFNQNNLCMSSRFQTLAASLLNHSTYSRRVSFSSCLTALSTSSDLGFNREAGKLVVPMTRLTLALALGSSQCRLL